MITNRETTLPKQRSEEEGREGRGRRRGREESETKRERRKMSSGFMGDDLL